MEDHNVTLLLALAEIVRDGALKEIGKSAVDAVIKRTFTLFKNKAPNSATAHSIEARQPIDEQQAYSELQSVIQDPEVIQSLAEVRSLIAQNQELQAKLDAELAKIRTRNIQVNRDRSQGYQFNEKVEAKFVGGSHYHGADPD
jgi:DUF1680 family protein